MVVNTAHLHTNAYVHVPATGIIIQTHTHVHIPQNQSNGLAVMDVLYYAIYKAHHNNYYFLTDMPWNDIHEHLITTSA